LKGDGSSSWDQVESRLPGLSAYKYVLLYLSVSVFFIFKIFLVFLNVVDNKLQEFVLYSKKDAGQFENLSEFVVTFRYVCDLMCL